MEIRITPNTRIRRLRNGGESKPAQHKQLDALRSGTVSVLQPTYSNKLVGIFVAIATSFFFQILCLKYHYWRCQRLTSWYAKMVLKNFEETINLPNSVQMQFSFQYVNIRVQQKHLVSQPTKGRFSEKGEWTDGIYGLLVFCFVLCSSTKGVLVQEDVIKNNTKERSVTCFVFLSPWLKKLAASQWELIALVSFLDLGAVVFRES